MKSPFPGMDPYIEACGLWEDFHMHLIEKIYESLADAVPANYLVRTGERGYVVLADKSGGEQHHPVTDSEPLTLRAFIEEEFRETFVEIYDSAEQDRLVTGIEVLS